MKSLRELRDGLPANLGREEALAWLRAANQTVDAAVGLTATSEQMRLISADEWHALKEADPFEISDLVRDAHQRFRERFG